MTKNEFKQGDKVATTKCYDIAINGYSTTIPIGEVGVIEDVYEDELYVYISEYHVYLTLPISEVEPIQPLDRKTAFLTRLQSLMREYNAKIECWQSDFESVAMAIIIGDDMVEYNSGDKSNLISVIADNIMDFDKE